MIIDCISDLHGYYPKLEGGDLLIVAGDLTARDQYEQYCQFFEWFEEQQYARKIIVAGNHDTLIEKDEFHIHAWLNENMDYLCDSGTEFEGLKIWGSPWIAGFEGMNPHCMAFTMPFGCDTEEHLKEHWDLIPNDTDLLITHSPPYGARDRAKRHNAHGFDCVGSKTLQMKSLQLDLKLWIVGHIHEDYGIEPLGGLLGGNKCQLVNASLVNEHYQPVNKPIRVIL